MLSVCCLFLTSIVKISVKLDSKLNQDTQYEWHLFLIQLEPLLSKSEVVEVYKDKLVLNEQGESAVYTIEKYNTMIRRKKGGTGHEPLLTGVQQVAFSEEGEGVRIEVDFLQGQSREARLPVKRKKDATPQFLSED